jgi:hypothetical protein
MVGGALPDYRAVSLVCEMQTDTRPALSFFLNKINEKNIMQTAKPHLELLTCEAAYRHNPTALFHQVCGARPATLLLESADIDSKDDLKSLLLVDSALRITALGDTVTIKALSDNGASLLPLLDAALLLASRMNITRRCACFIFHRSVSCWMKTPACAPCLYSMPSDCCKIWFQCLKMNVKPCSLAGCLRMTWSQVSKIYRKPNKATAARTTASIWPKHCW